jgi:hypothetical protein
VHVGVSSTLEQGREVAADSWIDRARERDTESRLLVKSEESRRRPVSRQPPQPAVVGGGGGEGARISLPRVTVWHKDLARARNCHDSLADYLGTSERFQNV